MHAQRDVCFNLSYFTSIDRRPRQVIAQPQTSLYSQSHAAEGSTTRQSRHDNDGDKRQQERLGSVTTKPKKNLSVVPCFPENSTPIAVSPPLLVNIHHFQGHVKVKSSSVFMILRRVSWHHRPLVQRRLRYHCCSSYHHYYLRIASTTTCVPLSRALLPSVVIVVSDDTFFSSHVLLTPGCTAVCLFVTGGAASYAPHRVTCS